MMQAAALLCMAAAFGASAAPLRACLVSGSFEYESDVSLDAFKAFLEGEYEAECTLLKAAGWEDLPGLEALDDCDTALFFTRRLRRDIAKAVEKVSVKDIEHPTDAELEQVRQAIHGAVAAAKVEPEMTQVFEAALRLENALVVGVD